MARGWIGVDLDGTLAEYTSVPPHLWDAFKIGKPVPKMLERVKEWLANGYEVRIVTARVAIVVTEGAGAMGHLRFIQQVARRIQDWCEEQGLGRLKVTAQKDYDMLELWDDRAVSVEKNTGRCLTDLQPPDASQDVNPNPALWTFIK
jgi:hypothetical protein